MANFKVGDRVKLVAPRKDSPPELLKIGLTGTITSGYGLCEWFPNDGFGYEISWDFCKSWACYVWPDEIVPLAPPHEKEWESFKELYLKPNPVLETEKT